MSRHTLRRLLPDRIPVDPVFSLLPPALLSSFIVLLERAVFGSVASGFLPAFLSAAALAWWRISSREEGFSSAIPAKGRRVIWPSGPRT